VTKDSTRLSYWPVSCDAAETKSAITFAKAGARYTYRQTPETLTWVSSINQIGGADQAAPSVSATTAVPGPAPLDRAAMNAATVGKDSPLHAPAGP